MANQIKRKYILDNAVDGTKVQLENNQALRAKKADDSDQSIFKLDGDDKLQFEITPRVDALTVFSDDDQLVNKKYVDDGITAAGGDISALQSEVDATQAGAGLGTGGAYSPHLTSNYISGATSLHNADSLLDAEIKSVADDVLDIQNDYGAANGLATLDGSGKIVTSQLPALAITDVYVVADIAARDALTVEEGDVAKVTDAGAGLPRTYIYKEAEGLNPAAWIEIESGSDVDSVNGFTGAVVLTASDIGSAGASTVQADIDALESEDLTFLKLDGTRPMTGSLDLNSNDLINVSAIESVAVSSMTITAGLQLDLMSNGVMNLQPGSDFAVNAAGNATVTGESVTLVSTVGPVTFSPFAGQSVVVNSDLDMSTHKIVGLVDGVANSDASTVGQMKTYADQAELDAIASANSYTDTEVSSVQNELDATQIGAGLGTDGSYSAPVGSNYLGSAVSLKDADDKLDAAIKAEETRAIAAENSKLSLSGGTMSGNIDMQGLYELQATTQLSSVAAADLSKFSLVKPQEVSTTDNTIGAVKFSRMESSQIVQADVTSGKAGVLQANSLSFLKEGSISTLNGDLSFSATGGIIKSLSNISLENNALTNVDAISRQSGDMGVIAISGNLVLDASIQVKVETQLSMESNKIVSLADGVDNSDASTVGQMKTYADQAELDAIASANSYTDTEVGAEETRALAAEGVLQGLIDALEAVSVEFVQERFVLQASDITNGYIDLANLAYADSINAFVDRLAIHKEVGTPSSVNGDYTVSVVGGVTRITFINSLVTVGQEKLSAGDEVRVKYAKVAIV